MNLEEFKSNPMSIMNTAYKAGFFHVSRAPENAPGEVILASLYRAIGYKTSEGSVAQDGRKLSAKLAASSRTDQALHTGIKDSLWKFTLEEILKSPKQPNQPKKKFIQLTPIVPDASLYSLAARYSGNPWNPGALISSIICYGCKNSEDTKRMWMETFKALSVDESDDIWAQFISQELSSWREGNHTWEMNQLKEECRLNKNDRMKYKIPAKQFVKDLQAVYRLKTALTRRQWVSMMESLVRIGSASHILWICEVNKRVWATFKKSLQGIPPPTLNDFGENVMSYTDGFYRYGEAATQALKEKARDYLVARVGINYILFLIEEMVEAGKLGDQNINFESVEGIYKVSQLLYKNRNTFKSSEISNEIMKLLEKDPRIMACSRGTTSNTFEFLRYSLGQRRTVEKEARNYDQGYWIKKKGNRWIFASGPVSLMTLSYCCSQESTAPRTIDDFCRHLKRYGIIVNPVELSSNGLSQSLRDLGIVIDSPDAEGGMVILNPFKNLDIRNE